MNLGSKKLVAVIVILIVIVAAVGAYYFSGAPVNISVRLASSTNLGTAGSPVSFSVLTSPAEATVDSVTWLFGDGTNETTSGSETTHTYANGGTYLTMVMVSVTYQSFLRTFSTVVTNGLTLLPLKVQPSLTENEAQYASVPTIDFQLSKNPSAPVLAVGEVVDPVGGFLQQPANPDWAIQSYTWNFGNDLKQVVTADQTTGLPSQTATTSYSQPGIYPLSLTLTTQSSTGKTFSVTATRTVAVQSSDLPLALLTSGGGVVNPKVITAAEVAPGGPFSFDPQTDYESVGLEVINNIYQALVFYNGSSTTSFIPYAAAELPTQENGGISPDFTTYTFKIRDDQYFSNGDKLTAYDVWFTFERCIAFASGSPGTPTWIQTQYLVPGAQNGTASAYSDNTWPYATSSVTYDEAANTVTFHFNTVMEPTLVFQILTTFGAGIVDAKYAASVGASFEQSSEGFEAYKAQANQPTYNTKMQWEPVGSGPYMIQSYVPGQSIALAPNPHYVGVPGIPPVDNTVVINWVKTADTALLMLQDGQADTVMGLPSSSFPTIQQLQSKGIVNIYSYPTLANYFYTFNININKAMEASQLGPGFNEPPNYFADLPTRLAWINAYDYQGFIDNIRGNKKYGTKFAELYRGVIPQGMIYSVPPEKLGGLPALDIDAAKGNFSISAWHNMKIKVPIIVLAGDQTNLAGAQQWASILDQISGGNITAIVTPITHSQQVGNLVANQNPMPVYWQFWTPDYPHPSDYTSSMLMPGGWYTFGNNWTPENFQSLAPPGPNDMVNVDGSMYPQYVVYNWIIGNLTQASASTDPAVIQRSFEKAEQLGVAMGLYVFTERPVLYWYWRSWLHGVENQQNPMYAGNSILWYFWLTKG